MRHRPRDQRDLDRARRAATAVRAQGGSAMAAALAQIDAAFDAAAAVNARKLRVERVLRLGPHDPGVRARFGARAEMLRGQSLEAAIKSAERWRRDETKAFAIARAFGRGSPLSLDVLAELRVILRLMRFKRMRGQFAVIVAALGDEPIRTAAE
jgi:hypothetical protein